MISKKKLRDKYGDGKYSGNNFNPNYVIWLENLLLEKIADCKEISIVAKKLRTAEYESVLSVDKDIEIIIEKCKTRVIDEE